MKGIDIARSLLNLQHSRSIKIDRSDNLVCAYLWDQKSEQLARNQVYKWHGKRYEDQPIQCQLEMYDQSLFENSEEDSTLHQDDAVHPPSRSTVNHNNDGSLLEKNTSTNLLAKSNSG